MGIDWVNTLSVSVSMAVDCMTVGAVDGIEHPSLKKGKIFLTAFLFGFMQALMPTIGYFVGYKFRGVLSAYIPWIAFALLSALALKNLIEWIKDRKEKKEIEKKEKESVQEKKDLKFTEIFVQSVATSIDALCIGFVYLDYDIPSALTVFRHHRGSHGRSVPARFVLRKEDRFVPRELGRFARRNRLFRNRIKNFAGGRFARRRRHFFGRSAPLPAFVAFPFVPFFFYNTFGRKGKGDGFDVS